MQTTSRGTTENELARGKRGAAQFFWTWLVVATLMSVTGNVTHAVLHATAGTVGLAAGAALVPPVVLLAATHSVAVLVRIRVGGLTYWCALAMTMALASCAFVLSFDALRSLAITLGLPPSIAWLWPCAIDVAIAQATLCLLSLSRRGVVETYLGQADAPPKATLHRAARAGDRASDTALGQTDTAAVRRWQPMAESMVRDGITSKDPGLVAIILAQREAGVPPSTIGRIHKVHHTTVGRILSAAAAFAA